MLPLGCFYPFLPLGLSHINKPEIFLYLLMAFQGPGGISMHWFPLEFFYLLVSNSGLMLILDILGSSFLYIRSDYFCRECLAFTAYYYTNLLNLSLLAQSTTLDQQQQHFMQTPLLLINAHHFVF